MGKMKGLILIGSETLRIFTGTFFEEEGFSLLHKLRLEQGELYFLLVTGLSHLVPLCSGWRRFDVFTLRLISGLEIMLKLIKGIFDN